MFRSKAPPPSTKATAPKNRPLQRCCREYTPAPSLAAFAPRPNMVILRQISMQQSWYCPCFAAPSGYGQRSAPFRPCSGASFSLIGFLQGDLRSSGRGIWRFSGVLLRSAGAALPDADTRRLFEEVCPEVPAAHLPCVPPHDLM